MAITSRSTKAELLAHIVSQDAALLAQGHTIRALRDELSMVRPAPCAPAPAPVAPAALRDLHTAYYAYVAQQRVVCRAAGLRTVTYKTFAQWSAA